MPNESHLNAGDAAVAGPSGPEGRGPGYEVRDTNVKAIATFVVVLFAVLVATQVGLWWFLKGIAGGAPDSGPSPNSPYAESSQPGPKVLPATTRITPEVVLEITEQRRELTARERATLGGYAVAADNGNKGGTYRIPIDRALALIAERGLPPSGKPPRTEVDVNSHSGKPDPDDVGKPGAGEKGPKK